MKKAMKRPPEKITGKRDLRKKSIYLSLSLKASLQIKILAVMKIHQD
jgi:hypothetical protein